MNGEGVNDSSGSSPEIIEHLRELVGRDVVLIWAHKGEKRPTWRRWQKTRIDSMSDERYVKNLAKDRNVAVLTGEPSGGLCSIDIDDDEAVEPFLALNPQLRETLRSRGRRGCIRAAGDRTPPLDRCLALLSQTVRRRCGAGTCRGDQSGRPERICAPPVCLGAPRAIRARV